MMEASSSFFVNEFEDSDRGKILFARENKSTILYSLLLLIQGTGIREAAAKNNFGGYTKNILENFYNSNRQY